MKRVLSLLLLLGLCLALPACGSSDDKPMNDNRKKSTETSDADDPASDEDAEEETVTELDEGEEEEPFEAGPDALQLLLGSRGGTYYALGTAYARQATEMGTPLQPLESPGSVENLYLVGLGQADAAFVQGNVLTEPRYAITAGWVEVVAPLFEEEVHLIAHRDAGIESVADLKGKKVGLGGRGSGVAPTSRAILTAAGLSTNDVEGDQSPPDTALDKVVYGKLDAAFFVGGVPVNRIADLTPQAHENLVMVSIGDEVRKKTLAANPALKEATIPERTYIWQPDEVPTLSVPCLLVASKELADEKKIGLKKAIQANDALAEAHVKGRTFGDLSWDVTVDPNQVDMSRNPSSPFVLLSAGERGTYDAVARGTALATETLAERTFEVVPTEGSFRNLLLLASGNADFGLMQLDILQMAARKEKFQPLLENLRLVLPLFGEEIHIVVRDNAEIDGLKDMEGKRVYTGLAASGTAATVPPILSGLGIRYRAVRGGAQGALVKLLAGKLDAFFLVGGQPVDLLASLPPAYEENIDLIGTGPLEGYPAAEIPAEAYEWNRRAVTTGSTQAYLICRKEVPEGVVGDLLSTLFAERANLARSIHSKFGELDIDRVTRALSSGTPLPAHPGATKALEGGLEPDSNPERTWKLDEYEVQNRGREADFEEVEEEGQTVQ